jgi:uncharacterized protein (TIGR02466 family)
MKTLFSTYVEQAALKLPKKTTEELKRTSIKLREIDQAGVKWCKKNYVNGYTSYGSISQLHQQFSVFDILKKSLDREVKKFSQKLGMKFNTGSLELSAIWVNVMPKGCYHAFHAHPLSVISGTYYVSVDQESSPLRVEDPRASLFMACPPKKIQIDLQPKNGDVILFESWLKHEVPPHQSNEERISVSFNYDWIDR